MKKILLTFLFCSIALSQVMDSREPTLKPLKGNKIVNNESLKSDGSGIIIFDKEKSKVAWIGGLKYGMSNHDGNLKISSGSLNISKDIKLSGNVVISMLSMSNNDLPTGAKERLIGHLKSADFFNVNEFPTASFSIKNSDIIQRISNNTYMIKVTGDLTIKGMTNEITFNTTMNLEDDVKKASGKFVFNRTDFGVQYRAEMHIDNPNSFWNQLQTSRDAVKDKVIRDEIEIRFSIESLPGLLVK